MERAKERDKSPRERVMQNTDTFTSMSKQHSISSFNLTGHSYGYASSGYGSSYGGAYSSGYGGAYSSGYGSHGYGYGGIIN